MSVPLPLKQLGVFFTRTSRTLRQFDVVPPGPGEVLIKNVAVASNPKDWKVVLLSGLETVEGNDVAGYVEAVGEGVSEFKKGDKVAAFTRTHQANPKWGAYQQYSTASAHTTFPLGPGTPFEAAATLPLAAATAFFGLYKYLRLPAFTDGAAADGAPLVVYGAAGSVGAYVVQLAKLSGLYVVGIAGASADVALSLGADVVVDYRGKAPADIVLEVQAALQGHGELHHVFDAVSEGETIEIGIDLLRETGGCYAYVLSIPEGVAVPDNVRTERAGPRTAYGEDAEFAAKMFRALSPLVENGTFKPNRVRIVPGGLGGVDEGMELLKSGKVHGEKLVYRIAETEGLAGR
ncbi:hypothetical protein PLICRDRAFT_164277 [Plicaturopsis crispa FD-325 SS-3]|nr:hypothetical protein PLICRDRAFT_164277 [Plicaturopsis crispa FD-325 SS-3]